MRLLYPHSYRYVRPLQHDESLLSQLLVHRLFVPTESGATTCSSSTHQSAAPISNSEWGVKQKPPTIREEMSTPNSTGNDDSWYTHWDCSTGATGSSLLSASYDAWRNLKGAKNRIHKDGKGDGEEYPPTGYIGVQDFPSTLHRILPPTIADQCTITIQSKQKDASWIKITWDTIDKRVPDLKLADAKKIIEEITCLPISVKEKALEIFLQLEDAFFETTAADTADIQIDDGMNGIIYCVGAILVLHDLQVSRVSISSLPCAERAPLETLYLLKGLSVNTGSQGLVTPLAAAMLRGLSSTNSRKPPHFILRSLGVSSFTDTSPSTEAASVSPSIRLLLGTVAKEATNDTQSIQKQQQQQQQQQQPKSLWKTDYLIHMEANLDDISAEALAFAVEILLKYGAMDAWVAPIVMKKGRAAHTLHCLCLEGKKESDDSKDTICTCDRLLKLIFENTTTLGIRIHRNLERAALRRSFLTVQTPYKNTTRKGLVDVKLGYLGDDDSTSRTTVSVKAEFDHCREIALETGVPIQQIAAFATQEAWKSISQSK